jgi:hypothetical protein
MFLFKKKKITVDAFTSNVYAEKFFPIAKASNFIPKWLQETPSYEEVTNKFGLTKKIPTIRRCVGIQDLYKNSFIIPLWSSFILDVKSNGEYSWDWSDETASAGVHSRLQLGKGLDHLLHLKLESPWYLKEKTGINFIWHQPTWNMLNIVNNLHVPPAIINYKYQVGTNINLLFPKTKTTLELLAGQPMAHIVPITDYDVEIKTHLVSRHDLEKISKLYNTSGSFLGKYVLNKKLLQALEK